MAQRLNSATNFRLFVNFVLGGSDLSGKKKRLKYLLPTSAPKSYSSMNNAFLMQNIVL